MTVRRIFIGYDSREVVAFHVLVHSILKHATEPVSIVPLKRSLVAHLYDRPRTDTESTEFSMTRFLVPYLSGYRGLSLFMDCDMLVRSDITALFRMRDEEGGPLVWCCQHDYVPKETTKFLGEKQTAYPRKNWSSLMLFDNALCRGLTPAYVNTAPGLDLHRFNWIAPAPEPFIGKLPLEWNWLQGEYAPNPDAKVLHWTLGGPWLPGYEDAPDVAEWHSAFHEMNETMFAPRPEASP